MKRINIILKKVQCQKSILMLFLLLSLSSQILGQDKNQALRILVIGNSFSRNATSYLQAITKEKGKKLVIGSAELGGHSLEQHWKYVEAAEANPEDSVGKPYRGKSLKMLLTSGTWDMVTLQQYSYLSADLESYSPYAAKLYAYIKALQPNAEIILHQTWAYRSDAKKFGRVKAGQLAKDQTEMWQKSREAYHAIAKQLKTRIIPVGDAFNKVASDPAHTYKKDEGFDYLSPVFPNLPDQTNSLNVGYYWNAKKGFAFDANHANEAGRYLGSLIWYAFLFKDAAENVQFVPAQVSADMAKYLKKVADQVVNHSIR